MKSLRIAATIAVCSLLPCIPFALLGYAGHDFPFHINSWMEMHTAWQHGHLNPGWAARSNFGLGDPRFCFYPPLSFFLGTLLTFCLPLKFAPAAFTSIALFLGGLSMYKVSRHYVAEQDRLTAAILYICSPYLLLTAVNRFAVAELLAAAWLPLVLHFFYAAISTRKLRPALLLGCSLALTILTNIPAATLMLYLLLLAAVVASIRQRSLRPTMAFGISSLIGGALSAFYSVPAYFEKVWVTPQSMIRFDWMSAFLFIPISHLNHKGFQLSCWIFACVETAILIVLTIARWKQNRKSADALDGDSAIAAFTAIGVGAFVFQLPFTAALWRVLPMFSLIVFPYRFLCVLAAVLPLVLLARGKPPTWRKPAYVGLAAMACLPLLGYSSTAFQFLRRPYAPFAEQIALDAHGYHSLPEYMPAGTVQPRSSPGLPEAAVLEDVPSAANHSACTLTVLSSAPTTHTLATQSVGPCRVRLAVYFYPYWQARDEAGQTIAIGRDAAGLMLIDVPPGDHTVHIEFVMKSRVRTVMAALSLATVLLIALILSGKTLLEKAQIGRLKSTSEPEAQRQRRA